MCSWIAPSESVISIIHNVVKGVNPTENPCHLVALQQQSPILFKVLTDCISLPFFSDIVALINSLLECALRPFQGCNIVPPNSKNEDSDAFFPHLPLIRQRGHYLADRKLQRIQSGKCTKKSSRHPSLLPGVFTMFCPHG